MSDDEPGAGDHEGPGVRSDEKAEPVGRGDDVSGVELEDLTVAFGDVTALEDVSLAVARGEFFTLVGPSGCGKTTTLRAVAGFEEPTAGTVRIGGEDVAGVPPEGRNVGIVFQHYALFPHLDVRENVAYGLRFRDPPGGASTAERVDELLALVDLQGLGDRAPERLSGGQQQRVALARALAPGPDVLLLDEPLSALDARLRERLRVTVRDVQRELDITTIYVTHDQAEALAVSDRVAVLRDGRVEQVGTPESLYRNPTSRFVAEFVGDNNLLEGTVTSTDPPTASVSGATVPLPPDAAVQAAGRLGVGDAVILAIRPEDLSVGAGDGSGSGDGSEAADVALGATVATVEFLGDAYRVHCDWRGSRLVVTAGERLDVGESIGLGVDAADVTLVEAGSPGEATGGYK